VCNNHSFRFDENQAYADQLVSVLESGPAHTLAAPEAPTLFGVYALYIGAEQPPVYVGKVIGERGLRVRLREYSRKISRRDDIDLADVTCRYICVPRAWEAIRAKDVLIKHYDPPWNRRAGSGEAGGAGST
jgi:excinuclease UvrABC nuclease subunit